MNVNLFPCGLLLSSVCVSVSVRACVCMRECAVMGESVYVCMHAHTFCGGAVSTLFRPYRSHFLLGKKKQT